MSVLLVSLNFNKTVPATGNHDGRLEKRAGTRVLVHSRNRGPSRSLYKTTCTFAISTHANSTVPILL